LQSTALLKNCASAQDLWLAQSTSLPRNVADVQEETPWHATADVLKRVDAHELIQFTVHDSRED
jgi:hypothetical protein